MCLFTEHQYLLTLGICSESSKGHNSVLGSANTEMRDPSSVCKGLTVWRGGRRTWALGANETGSRDRLSPRPPPTGTSPPPTPTRLPGGSNESMLTEPFTQCPAGRKQQPFLLLFFLFLFLLTEETLECHSQSNTDVEGTRGRGIPDRASDHPLALSEAERFSGMRFRANASCALCKPVKVVPPGPGRCRPSLE